MFIVTRIYFNTRFIWISVFPAYVCMHLGNWRQTDDSLLCLKLCSLTVCVPSWTPAASAERAARQAGTSHLFLETAEKRLERWKWGDTEWVNRLVCCFTVNLLRWACTYYDLSTSEVSCVLIALLHLSGWLQQKNFTRLFILWPHRSETPDDSTVKSLPTKWKGSDLVSGTKDT